MRATAAAEVNRCSKAMWAADAAYEADPTPENEARLDLWIDAYRTAGDTWAAAYASESAAARLAEYRAAA